MSRWIDADKCITAQFYDDEHEEWSEKSMTIAEFLDRETEEGCPSAEPQRQKGEWIDYTEDGYVECPFCHSATTCDGNKDELHFCFSCGADMRGERAMEKAKEGEWQITDAYPHNVYCSECHKRFAQTHWAVWEDGSLPRNYCPNCGAKMESEE